MKLPKANLKKILSVSLIVYSLFFINLYPQTVKLKIIETTDEHGYAFPFDFSDQKEANHSLAQVNTFVKEERSVKDQNVILLSGGDLLQGTPLVYYYNFEKVNVPHIWSEMMNFMQYDAAAVGNHDIETGHAVYDRVNKEFKFPWLAANAVYSSTGEQYFKPYTIIRKGEIKIAVLGLITPAIPNWLPPKIWEGMEFQDMVETARKWVAIIKEKEKPDLIVGLFHSGTDAAYGNKNPNMQKNENASQLVAEKVPGFDIVFAGHDHHGWNYTVTNSEGKKVFILSGSHSAYDAAVANVTMTFKNNSWGKEITGNIVQMKNYKPDQEFINKFQYSYDEVNNYVKKSIGTITETISTRESLFGPSKFVDLIQQVQLDLTGADVSFSAPLSFDTDIQKGEITVGSMFNLYKFENLLYTMELSGKEIKDYLEYSFKLWFNQMKNENDHLINFQTNDKGEMKLNERTKLPNMKYPFYNFDCAAGINYTVDLSKPLGDRVNIISFSNGAPFELTKKYKAAINSYRGNGGGGHLTDGANIPKDDLVKRILNTTEKDLRFYLMKWVEEKKNITPKLLGNWKIIPEEWWHKGKEKDFKLLYSKNQDD
jgi:2',3'-cyclic-nucleotide 2'-phosphodiesterase/3'-nucleotidase